MAKPLQKGKNAMNTYHPQTGKFLAALAQNIPQEISGDVMQGWIENPKALQSALRAALCPPTEMAEPEIKVWKRIKLGTGLKIADDFRKAIKDNDLRLGDWGNNILGKPEFIAATEPAEVDLVVMSVKDLGFKRATRYDQICARAKELGLELCPAEVGPQLRLQYLDQPKDEWLIIAMEAIRDSSGGLSVFRVGHGDDGRWLSAGCGAPGSTWYPGSQFVFVFPRK